MPIDYVKSQQRRYTSLFGPLALLLVCSALCAVRPQGKATPAADMGAFKVVRALLVLVYPVLGYVGPILCRPRRLQELRTSAESMEAQFTEVGESAFDLERRTVECLDFGTVLKELDGLTRTVHGSEISGERFYDDIEEVKLAYARVAEMGNKLESFPLRSNMDVEPLVDNIENNRSPPTREDLAKFTENLEQLAEVHVFLSSEMNEFTLFDEQIDSIRLPDELLDQFTGAFDDDENLSAEKYPAIKKLRTSIASVRSRIASKMNQLLSSQVMKDKIADSGYIIIEDRYCLMLKNTYKKGIGVVHGSSNTGRTIYVEPFEVVDMTNEMKSMQGQLRAEENRILSDMCRAISEYREEIRQAVEAVAEVDVIHAKARLGASLKGVVPDVNNEGRISCENAKHPVLILRGTDAIGNDINLGSDSTAMVISGPNAGGKTIILKTAGLFALMAKHAIPVPARDGARVDIFNVMADIGDMQTVSGDLSTFSGHLVVCREMLQKASNHQGHSLALLDEVGTGTDPAQGAALAQAILEDLISGEVRVMVTTHYQRIKELAAEDNRFRIAAMEFVDNKPTYRLRLGSVGESFALEAAERMSLPPRVLSRANNLLDDESRRILALQKALEAETERARQRQEAYESMLEQVKGKKEEVEAAKREVEKEKEEIRAGRKEEFLEGLKSKEKEAATIMEEIQTISMAKDLSKAEKQKAVTAKQAEVKVLRTEIESEIVEEVAEDVAIPLVSGEPVEEGKTLVVLERGILFQKKGIVTKRNKGRGRVHLRVAGAQIKIERHLVGYPLDRLQNSGMQGGQELLRDPSKKLTSKEREMIRMQEDLVNLDSPSAKGPKGGSGGKPQRKAGNTVDVRDLAFGRCQDRINDAISRHFDEESLYIYHGKGCEDQNKVRTWLRGNPLVEKVSDEGEYTLLQFISD